MHRPIFVVNTSIQVNYGLLYCVDATCYRIGIIVNESSYHVAESSCHRIGQLTNQPVSYLAHVAEKI